MSDAGEAARDVLRGTRAPRDVRCRIEVECRLELTTPVHVGGADADATTDRPVLRDVAGVPYVPGSTLCGVLRSALRRYDLPDETAPDTSTTARRGGASTPDDPTAFLFGSGADVEAAAAHQSRILVSDAPFDSARVGTEYRDGVAIDPARATAAERLKHDMELVQAGTGLVVRFEVLAPATGSRVRRHALACMQALESGEIRIGARTRRGFGATQFDRDRGWRIRIHDVGSREGLLSWLRGRAAAPERAVSDVDPPVYATASAVAQAWRLDVPSRLDDGTVVHRLCLRVAGPILIRASGGASGDADAAHLARRMKHGTASVLERVMSGTSLGGVLRARCLRIARTLAAPDDGERARRFVEDLFGPRPEATDVRATASRIRVGETVIAGGAVLRHGRARIDPWTGGAADRLLFHEDVLFGGAATGVEIALTPRRSPRAALRGDDTAAAASGDAELSAAERGLVLLALRDLAVGDLPVGGGSGIGRGRVLAESWTIQAGGESINLRRCGRGIRTTDDREFGGEDIAALHRWLGGGVS